MTTALARYDGLADWYDAYARSNSVTPAALASLAHLLGSGPGTCLDIGCGTGVAFPSLVALGWRVVGVDVSADQLEVAAARGDVPRTDLVHADAARLPFPDATFGAVVSVLTHTDFENLAAVFHEAARVTMPGGRLVYVGVHPCFVAPMVERRVDAPHLLHPGYRRSGWWPDPSGPVRSRVGVNHVPLAGLLNAVLAAGFTLERVEEPGEDDYPMLIAVSAVRDAARLGAVAVSSRVGTTSRAAPETR